MMSKAHLLLTAGFVAGIFAAGNAAETPASDAAWRTAKADAGRTVSARGHASWSRAYARAGEARHGGGDGHTAYGAAWEDLGSSHLIGYPYYECPFFAVGVAGDSLGAVTPGALGTSR